MQARDVMTTHVITVGPETPVVTIAKLLVEHRISGVPVMGMADRVLGMVTEGDLCRRTDLGTEKDRSRWRELFTPNSELAQEYLRTHGLTAGDVMTEGVVSVGPDTPLREVADRMEAYRVERVPVVDNGKLVGILTRANLVQALAALAPSKPEQRDEDQRIRDQILAEYGRQPWGVRNAHNVTVEDGIVHLFGTVNSHQEQQALELVAKQIPGVEAVENHTILAWDDWYPRFRHRSSEPSPSSRL